MGNAGTAGTISGRLEHEDREGREEDQIHGCLWPDWRFATVAAAGCAAHARRTPVKDWAGKT